jgi:hypothetical protein
MAALTPDCVARFWRKVDVRGADECWLWQRRPRVGTPYGQMGTRYDDGTFNVEYAHRISYAIEHGSIPTGKQVLHTCDEYMCVNPRHLYAGTPADNGRDRRVRNRGLCPPGCTCGKHSQQRD